MTSLAPGEPFILRQTNVSNPSIVHSRPSQQSITASEDYYSLSGSSHYSNDGPTANDPNRSTNTVGRYNTPPSRYRTPLQSRDRLALTSRDNLVGQPADGAAEDVRRTPLRGQGTRRHSHGSYTDPVTAEAGPSIPPPAAIPREGGVRRKPVPSTVMEGPDSPRSQEYIDQTAARSSVARDFDRGDSPPTPGMDDTPYIRFAVDQLTRDEEVRGSRHYGSYENRQDIGDNIYIPHLQPGRRRAPQEEAAPAVALGVADGAPFGAASAAMPGAYPEYDSPNRSLDQPATEQWPLPQRAFDEPPPRNPKRGVQQQQQRQDEISRLERPLLGRDAPLFQPVSGKGRNLTPLEFLPGILRPLPMALFMLLLLAYIALLMACAIISLAKRGLFAYGYFGDSKYFICEYLPSLLGTFLLLWLVQIQVALYRITPFIALCSPSSRSREAGTRLPLYPRSFFWCYTGHLRAGQPVVGLFMIVAWLQIFTVPLLGSAFNVYFYGPPTTGQWRWIATQGTTWTIIALYVLLLLSTGVLAFWLRRQQTGVRWDPRSLADMVVLLERSNALTLTEDEELRYDPAKLGYWRTDRHQNEVFHTYGIAEKPARAYSLEDGRLREKAPAPAALQEQPKSKFSDTDLEMSREQRHSRERILPRHSSSDEDVTNGRGRALPWFLRPSLALLWAIIALVLLLAFLVVSYLPSITVFNGFLPDIAVPVDKLGFSATNFLYSFVPAILAMICLLAWLDIDYAYRRLQPYVALTKEHGELAEQSLLISYAADLPGVVTASAIANGHFRVAFFSLVTLIAATLPVLAGGVFWAQFYVPSQDVRVAANTTGFYPLTFFLCVYGLAYLFVIPSKSLRTLDSLLPRGNRATRFADVIALVAGSTMLDDIVFHSPASRADFVTRLLSAPPGFARVYIRSDPSAAAAAAASKVSLADSVRGFGRARQNATEGGLGGYGIPRYALGEYTGRDGREYMGIDRVRI